MVSNGTAAATQGSTSDARDDIDGPHPDSGNSDNCSTDRQQVTLSPKDPTAASGARRNTNEATDEAMADLTTSLSTLKFIPPSVRFGRGKGHGGLSKR